MLLLRLPAARVGPRGWEPRREGAPVRSHPPTATLRSGAGQLAQRSQAHVPPVICRSSVLWRPGDSSPFPPAAPGAADAPGVEKGAVVALGKFDALHKGHRSLAIQAAQVGSPWLMSFSGMAEVLGWPDRQPIVAPPDRARVLSTWACHCGGRGVREVRVPFADIRSLQPEEFVRLLAEDMGVAGVVCGANYRFGYRAAGDAAMLVEVGGAYGMDVRVADLVGATEPGVVGTVSSTRVREALAAGRVGRAAQLLGRAHRLVVQSGGADGGGEGEGGAWGGWTTGEGDALDLGGPGGCLNQPPGEGEYRVRAIVLPHAGGDPEGVSDDVGQGEGTGEPGTLWVGANGSMELALDRGLAEGAVGEAEAASGAYVVVDFEK